MKKIICLFLTFVMLWAFAGCDIKKYDTIKSDTTLLSDFSGGTEEDSLSSPPPTFFDLESLSKYLNKQKDKDVFDISFYYEGKEEMDPQILAQMANCFYINYSHSSENDLHKIIISEYPGEHIVDAYFEKNEVTLTSDEQKTLQQALSMLSVIKPKAKDDWELELFIHDMLADHITYYDKDVTDEELKASPRFLTAVGALLDGAANCQGYTDAFYLLASLAGFEVGRMNVVSNGTPHMVNTILLNGSWYVVDVTFDDQGNDSGISYQLFNAGLDQTNGLSWEPYNENHKITALSDNNSYYIRKGTAFNDADALAECIKEKWLAGEQTIKCVLRDQTDMDALKAPLEKALRGSGRGCTYKLWYYDDGKDLYYTVEIK